MMNRFFICILFFFTVFLASQAQTKILPLDIDPYLSGNFGELRSNHFHSGIDFKTQGKTGIPVKSIQDGYLSRAYVSPRGYGRALYVVHPDGTMTVYGHLDYFAREIESAVRDSQYRKESFSVDLSFAKEAFPVKRGEIIGYSGNTGSSGGPHLHFEIRETDSEKVTDPLVYYKNQITDTRPPEIRGLMIFPQAGRGIVNGKSVNQSISLTKSKTGKQSLAQPVKAWGDIGIGIKAYDRMTGTNNVYGVKDIILKVDGVEIFHSNIENFSFDESRYVNSFIDWNDWVENRSFYMKSFVEAGNRLDFYHTPYNGILSVNQEKTYQLEYVLSDVHGNQTTLAFEITGQKQAIPPFRSSGTPFPFNQDNEFSEKGMDLKIPKGNLYSDTYFSMSTVRDYTPYAPMYILGDRVPLHTSCPLSLKITADTYPDKEKYGIVSVVDDKQSWIGGLYEGGKMKANIRETGKFTITIDTIAPVITPLNQMNWSKIGKIDFKIKDNLSGVSRWKGTLDGRFVLFEFDSKNAALFCKFDSQRMKRGKQTLKLTVTDACGNQSTYEDEISF